MPSRSANPSCNNHKEALKCVHLGCTGVQSLGCKVLKIQTNLSKNIPQGFGDAGATILRWLSGRNGDKVFIFETFGPHHIVRGGNKCSVIDRALFLFE